MEPSQPPFTPSRLDTPPPLLKPLKHAPKELTLILEAGGQVVHVGIGWLALEPYFGVCSAVMEIHTQCQGQRKALQVSKKDGPNDVLDPAAVEAHEHKVLELGVHR